MMVIAMLSSPPGLSRISMMIPFRDLKSRAMLLRATVRLLFNALQLKDANVAKFVGPAVVKHPSLGPSRLTEPMADKSLLGRLEKLLDLSLCKFFVESGFLLWAEISWPLMPASLDPQLDMPVIQRIEHLAEDIEKLIIACLLCDFGSVRVVLLFPVDIPKLKKWVTVVEGIPQRFEIPFRGANHDR